MTIQSDRTINGKANVSSVSVSPNIRWRVGFRAVQSIPRQQSYAKSARRTSTGPPYGPTTRILVRHLVRRGGARDNAHRQEIPSCVTRNCPGTLRSIYFSYPISLHFWGTQDIPCAPYCNCIILKLHKTCVLGVFLYKLLPLDLVGETKLFSED